MSRLSKPDKLAQAAERIRAQRKALKKAYGALYDDVSQLLFEADSIGLAACGCPNDEYEPEVGTILPRLRTANSADEVAAIIREEFARWFGPLEAGKKKRYMQVAGKIWDRYQRESGSSNADLRQ